MMALRGNRDEPMGKFYPIMRFSILAGGEGFSASGALESFGIKGGSIARRVVIKTVERGRRG